MSKPSQSTLRTVPFSEVIRVEDFNSDGIPRFCCGHIEPGQAIDFESEKKGKLKFRSGALFGKKEYDIPEGSPWGKKVLTVQRDAKGGEYIFEFIPSNSNHALECRIVIKKNVSQRAGKIIFRFFQGIGSKEWRSDMRLHYSGGEAVDRIDLVHERFHGKEIIFRQDVALDKHPQRKTKSNVPLEFYRFYDNFMKREVRQVSVHGLRFVEQDENPGQGGGTEYVEQDEILGQGGGTEYVAIVLDGGDG